jgi:hypothetical protein
MGAGDVGADIDLGGQDIREAGLQKHVVERYRLRESPEFPVPAPLPTPFGGSFAAYTISG